MTVDILDSIKENMADQLLTALGTDGWLILYAADGTLANHTGGIPDGPQYATDATVLAKMQFQTAATPTGNGQIVFSNSAQMQDSNAEASENAAWGRFMSNTVYNAGAGKQAAGTMDCSVGVTSSGEDVELNSVAVVAGGIVTLTAVTYDVT